MKKMKTLRLRQSGTHVVRHLSAPEKVELTLQGVPLISDFTLLVAAYEFAFCVERLMGGRLAPFGRLLASSGLGPLVLFGVSSDDNGLTAKGERVFFFSHFLSLVKQPSCLC